MYVTVLPSSRGSSCGMCMPAGLALPLLSLADRATLLSGSDEGEGKERVVVFVACGDGKAADTPGAAKCAKVIKKRRNEGDQVIREPGSRGTETSAEVLVGPPGRMVSNAGQQQWYEGGHPLLVNTLRKHKPPSRQPQLLW